MVANPEVIMTNAISGKPACITKGLKNGDFGKFNPATCPKRQLTAKATNEMVRRLDRLLRSG
jgi:hypothetical protein